MAEDDTTEKGRETKRLESKKQNLSDAYAVPANFLEIDVVSPETHGIGKKRYTDYEVRLKVSRSALHVRYWGPFRGDAPLRLFLPSRRTCQSLN